LRRRGRWPWSARCSRLGIDLDACFRERRWRYLCRDRIKVVSCITGRRRGGARSWRACVDRRVGVGADDLIDAEPVSTNASTRVNVIDASVLRRCTPLSDVDNWRRAVRIRIDADRISTCRKTARLAVPRGQERALLLALRVVPPDELSRAVLADVIPGLQS